MTRALLWQEYRLEHPDGFGYSWFCEGYDAWKGSLSPTMRQSHAAGEKVFVDYAGDTIDVYDPLTGLAQPMKLFVAAMGASAYVFAQARASESLLGLDRGACGAVRLSRRRAQDRGLRQPQGRRHQPRPP